MTTQPPLDPRKYPWHRGDIFTANFQKSGFVINSEPDYLEVMWMPGSTRERLDAVQADKLLRIAHAESVSADRVKTNAEVTEAILTLDSIQNRIEKRNIECKTERERKRLDDLVVRWLNAAGKHGCDWDIKHAAELYALAVVPQSTGLVSRMGFLFRAAASCRYVLACCRNVTSPRTTLLKRSSEFAP